MAHIRLSAAGTGREAALLGRGWPVPRVLGFGLRVLGFGLRVLGFGLRVLGFGLRV